jgi:hypothetical protein
MAKTDRKEEFHNNLRIEYEVVFYKIFLVKIDLNIRNYTYKIGNKRNHSLSWETERGTNAYIPDRNIAHEQSHIYKAEKPGREHTYTQIRESGCGKIKTSFTNVNDFAKKH